jgi:putative SOS response-associated peptidase YedK
MCGRYATEYTWSEIHAFSQAIGIETPAQNPEPAYNIAPTQSSFVLLPHGPRLALARRLRFGLIPRWATGEKTPFSTFNARLETVATKPAFREPRKRHRCIVPVSRYYEWVGAGFHKEPYFIHAKENPVLMLAGLFEPSPTSQSKIKTKTKSIT